MSPPARPQKAPRTSIAPVTAIASAGYAASGTALPAASMTPRVPIAERDAAPGSHQKRTGPRLRGLRGRT